MQTRATRWRCTHKHYPSAQHASRAQRQTALIGSAGCLSRPTLKSRKTSQTKIDRTAVHILNEPRPVALRKAPVIRLRVIGHIAEFSEPGAKAGPSAYPDVTDRHYSFPQQSGPDNAGLSERWPNEGNLASYQARSAVMSTHTMTIGRSVGPTGRYRVAADPRLYTPRRSVRRICGTAAKSVN